MTQRINAADLHQRIGEIIGLVRVTGERFLIERRGKPVAAVISVKDLERLQNMAGRPRRQRSRAEQITALNRAAAVRQLIAAERNGKKLPDSAQIIREMREERARHVAGGD